MADSTKYEKAESAAEALHALIAHDPALVAVGFTTTELVVSKIGDLVVHIPSTFKRFRVSVVDAPLPRAQRTKTRAKAPQ